MSKLNKDILYLIFEELLDDSKSLFSCLMVNRLWCETVIPILWRNPWCYGINYNNKNHLFLIIVSYLSNDIKEFLSRQEIQVPTFSYQSLLFDYLSFCKSIHIDVINTIISIGTSLAYNQFILQQEFYNLIIKKCRELKYLDIGSINHQIYYFPEAGLRLETLYELRCDTSIDSLYFYGLARLCQYIQRVIINNVNINTNHGIVKLIEVQKNLKYFEWIDDLDECYDIRVDPYKEILLALGKNADTINHLELFFLYSDRTPPKVYPKFHKVKTLIINYFGSLNEEQLKMCIYHDLEVLKIGHYDLNAASIIIENSGRNLKKIYLEFCIYYDYYDNFNEHSHILIRKIHENCPSIKYLSLIFPPSKQHFNEFEILLQMCQNLKSLLLIIFMNKIRNEEKHLEYGEELLKILIRSSHNNLREIRFLYVKFSLESLEEFFEKWRGRPALSIVTCNRIYKEDNYVKLINKYKNNGVIKDFIYESHYNILNMDFKI